MVRRALPVLLVPVLLTGCSGDKRQERARLTQAEFVQQANQVCIRSDRRVFRLGQLSTDPRGWDRTVKLAGSAIAEMSRLRPPEDRQKQFDTMLATAQKLKRQIAHVRDELKKKAYRQAQVAQYRATEYDTRIKKLAERLGLTFCEQLLTNWPA
jgi:hypothetical protein